MCQSHANIIVARSGRQLCSHTLFQEHNSKEPKKHFESTWMLHRLCHNRLKRPGLQSLLGVACTVHIFIRQFAIQDHSTEHVMSVLIVPAVQCDLNPRRWHQTYLLRPYRHQPNWTIFVKLRQKNGDINIALVSRRLTFSPPISANFTAASHVSSKIHSKKFLGSRLLRWNLSINS